ncbi:MAG: hypothetical protein EZS28_010671 [Streblomastix strix]|uniref:Uncharacterized protein n=1 Tax=Streblomastix strix TaxID=222440 RepID=A0A5J4WHH0_9EUKA|nr:MAG: hypothetical protein EZS28_010671 [Streblomastix strix]
MQNIQYQINGYSQDIGQLQADVTVINTEQARQTSFRGYFTTNDEIHAFTDVSKGDYAYSAEDFLVWIYDINWVKIDQIVPDQMTPASDNTPLEDSGNGIAGIQTDYARGDHQHPINVSISVPINDTANELVGTSDQYARSDHSHPISISTSLPLQDSTGAIVTNVPIINAAAAANCTSIYYACQDHVHPQQLTFTVNGVSKSISDIAGDEFVVKTSKPVQSVQGFLRHAEFLYDDEKPSEESDDEDYQTRAKIYSTYVNKTQTEIIAGSRTSNCGAIQGQCVIYTSSINAEQAPQSLIIAVASQASDITRGLQISVDGNTLSFNGQVIAQTNATIGQTTINVSSSGSSGSVNYSAGNPILWGLNSVDTNGEFYYNGNNVYWRAHPLTMGSVPP